MTAGRPLPNLDDPLYGPHWRAARERRLSFQRCDACGYLRWPPEPICPECLADGGRWVDVAGTGTVWSCAIYEHAYTDAFRSEVPYNVALVELDAGPRIVSNIVGIANEDVQIGMRVQAEFQQVADGATLVRFRPIEQR